MHKHIDPIIDSWYDGAGMPECFRVIDYDKNDYVEIQYLDGELDRIDLDAWDHMHPEEIPAPEDAAAPFNLDKDEDIVSLLNEIEEQSDLDEHLHNLDIDEQSWM